MALCLAPVIRKAAGGVRKVVSHVHIVAHRMRLYAATDELNAGVVRIHVGTGGLNVADGCIHVARVGLNAAAGNLFAPVGCFQAHRVEFNVAWAGWFTGSGGLLAPAAGI